MSERSFRLILGFTLWGILIYAAYFETMAPVYAFIAILIFEGVTNLRITLIINNVRNKNNTPIFSDESEHSHWINNIDSERILRIVIAILVYSPFLVFPEQLWFLPWFIAGMLILAGITNICPMAMFLKWSGMK